MEHFQGLSNKLVFDMEGDINQLKMVNRNCDSNISPAIFTSGGQEKTPFDNIEEINIREQENANRTLENYNKTEGNKKTKGNKYKGKGVR